MYSSEQARREIEAEMRLKESEESEKSRSQLNSNPTNSGMEAQKVVDPACYAVDGVFFTCPLIGRCFINSFGFVHHDFLTSCN